MPLKSNYLQFFLTLSVALGGAACGTRVEAATSYYVSTTGNDTAPGTLEAPFASINAASKRVHPGDKVFIRGGTYYWNQRQVLNGGYEGNTVYYGAYPHEHPAFDASGVQGKIDAVTLTSHLELSGLEVYNSNKNACCLWSGSDVKVSYCSFHDCAESGFLASYSKPNSIKDVTVEYVQVYHAALANYPPSDKKWWPPALYAHGGDNVNIYSCVVDHNFGEGIDLNRCTNSSVKSCRVFDNWSVDLYLDNGSNEVVSGNIVYTQGDRLFYRDGNPAVGIGLAVEPDSVGFPSLGLKDIVVEDNMVSGCRYDISYAPYGLGGGIQGLRVEHNTLTNGYQAVVHIADDAHHSQISFKKNVFAQQNGKLLTDTPQIRNFHSEQDDWFGGDTGALKGTSDTAADPRLGNSRQREPSDFASHLSAAGSGEPLGARPTRSNVPAEPSPRGPITKTGGS